jgi:hypothetical protein
MLRNCVYMNLSDCVEVVYVLPFLPNTTAGKTVLNKSGAVGSDCRPGGAWAHT